MTTEKDVRPMCQHRTLRGACAEPRCACVAGHTGPHHDEFGRVIPPGEDGADRGRRLAQAVPVLHQPPAVRHLPAVRADPPVLHRLRRGAAVTYAQDTSDDPCCLLYRNLYTEDHEHGCPQREKDKRRG